MLLPESHLRLSLAPALRDGEWGMPPGFLPVWDRHFGDGDTWGLYWPIGHERREPLVAAYWHAGPEILPVYSSVDAFLRVERGDADDAEAEDDVGDEDGGDAEVDQTPWHLHDPDSPLARFARARTLVRSEPEAAARELERALERLPEYTNAAALLATVLPRLGRADEACRAAVRAVSSPPSFGERPKRLLAWFVAQLAAPPGLEDDPIWSNRQRLTLEPPKRAYRGGDATLLREAADAYAARGDVASALRCLQTSLELMDCAPEGFKRETGYRRDDLVERYIALSAALPGGPRVVPA